MDLQMAGNPVVGFSEWERSSKPIWRGCVVCIAGIGLLRNNCRAVLKVSTQKRIQKT